MKSHQKEPAAARRVLVVDDRVDVTRMMKLVLEPEGFEVRTAHDGPQAVEVPQRRGARVARGQGALSDLRREAQSMCSSDAFRLCSSEIPNIPKITACMISKRSSLSTGCRTVLDRDLAAQRAGKMAVGNWQHARSRVTGVRRHSLQSICASAFRQCDATKNQPANRAARDCARISAIVRLLSPHASQRFPGSSTVEHSAVKRIKHLS